MCIIIFEIRIKNWIILATFVWGACCGHRWAATSPKMVICFEKKMQVIQGVGCGTRIIYMQFIWSRLPKIQRGVKWFWGIEMSHSLWFEENVEFSIAQDFNLLCWNVEHIKFCLAFIFLQNTSFLLISTRSDLTVVVSFYKMTHFNTSKHLTLR